MIEITALNKIIRIKVFTIIEQLQFESLICELPCCFVLFKTSCFLTAMKATRQLPPTSHRAAERAEAVTAAVEGSLVVTMGAAGATHNRLSTEEVTTTSRRATTPLLRRATASRASTGRVAVRGCLVVDY